MEMLYKAKFKFQIDSLKDGDKFQTGKCVREDELNAKNRAIHIF